ncbi:MAG: glycosyltransferase family 39 protein [bacterium]|nr:glycosyltransferase family 39 protein [bacterium]
MSKNIKIHYVLLFLICIIAFVLRVWGVNFGLPGLFYIDERFLPYNAFYALTHKGHIPKAFFYGNLIPYLLSILYSIYFVVLKVIGIVRTSFDFLVLYMKDPTNVYLIGRMLFVCASTLSVWALYLFGSKLYNRTIGLLSAFFLAFSFLPIHQSKFMKGDSLGTLFLLFSFYFCIKDEIYHFDIKKTILAGVFMGFAVASRFTLYLAPIVPIIIYFISRDSFRLKRISIFSITTVFIFFISTPSIIFQFSDFTSEMYKILPTSTSLPAINLGAQPIWLFYFTEHLYKGIGGTLEITAILGIMCSLISMLFRPFTYRKIQELSIIIFLFLFFMLVLIHSPGWERYIIPAIPFFIIFASKFLYEGIKRIKVSLPIRQGIMGLCCIILMYPSLIKTLKYNYLISQPDTRNLAQNFIECTISSGTKIVSDGGELIDQSSVLGPPLRKSKKQLQDTLISINKQNIPGKLLSAMIDGYKEPTYILENVPNIEIPPYKVSKYDTTVEVYIEHGVDYLITSDWMRGLGTVMPERFLNSLEKEYELVKEFKPNPTLKWDYYNKQIDYESLGKVHIFDKKIVGGPVIKIYKKR